MATPPDPRQDSVADDIRTLTTILHRIRPHLASPATAQTLVLPKSLQSTARLYNHIATVLTTGREKRDCGGAAVRAISLTGAVSKSHGASIVVSSDEDETETSQNPRPAAKGAHRSNNPQGAIAISLSNPRGHGPAEGAARDLCDNVTELLEALPLSGQEFQLFVIHRSLPKIRHRVKLERTFWKKDSLGAILHGWGPQPGDSLIDGLWFPLVLTLAEVFEQTVPCPLQIRTSDEGCHRKEWLCDAAGAANWLRMIRNAFVKTVRDVEDAVGAKLEDTATMAAAANMSRLNAMLCNEGTQYLFTLPSLKERIASATVPDVRLPSYFAQSHPRVNLLDDDRASSVQVLEAMDEVSTDSGEESEDTTASFALRYMRSIVAWVPASRSVHSNLSKLVRSSIPATIHVVNSPPPVPSSVSPLDSIARNLPAAPEGHARAKASAIMEELGIPEQVRGAVHSEAALMAFIHRARDRGEGSLVSSPAAHDLDDALQGTTGVIGSAVKCCWCCAWLAEHLARHTDPHQTFTFKFHVAGSHGRIDPWAPPTGVPSAVLEELRTVLQEKLSSALKLKTYDPTAEGVASDRRHGGPASTTTDEEIFMSYASNPAHDE